MTITAAILHRIDKLENTSAPNSATVTPRHTQLSINDKLKDTADSVVRIYDRSINRFGTFDENQTRYPFATILRQYVESNGDFVAFTFEVAKLIATEMSTAQFANGGYVLFLRYSNAGKDWFMVVMLKLKNGTGIDPETLDLTDSLSFDIDHLREAARVDIEKWTANTQPYLSFVKKRSAGEDVTRYFRQALGCTEYIDAKHNTNAMMEAVRQFCTAKSLNTDEANEVRRRVYEYCDQRERSQEPVDLVALSAHLYHQDPLAFSEFVRDEHFEMSDSFVPYRKAFGRFKRIDARVGSVKVSFDVDDLLEDRVDYDAQHRYLIIKDLPQELIDKIHEVKPDNDTPA